MNLDFPVLRRDLLLCGNTLFISLCLVRLSFKNILWFLKHAHGRNQEINLTEKYFQTHKLNMSFNFNRA